MSCAALGSSVELEDQMSVRYKALVFQLICMSSYYTQGDKCFEPSKGRTFQQMEINPSRCSVGR